MRLDIRLVGICAAAAMATGGHAPASAEDVTYLLPAPLSLPAFGPFVLAKQRGYFKAEGLDITFRGRQGRRRRGQAGRCG